MTFWQSFGFAAELEIEKILDRESGCTLEELLNDSEILQESKAQNRKLVSFISRPEEIERIVHYIVSPDELIAGLEESPDDAKYRYPYVCCEIIMSDISEVIDGLMTNSNLELLFSVFDKPTPLPLLVASYSCRAILYLFVRKAQVLDFMRTKSNLIENLVKHLSSAPVMELLIKLTRQEERGLTEDVLEWLAQGRFVQMLIEQLGSEDISIHDNTASVLYDIVIVAQSSPLSSSSPLASQLLSRESASQLTDLILSKGESTLQHGLLVANQMIIGYRNNQQYEDNEPLGELPSIFQLIVEHLPRFNEILSVSFPDATHNTTFGTSIRPLGISRMRVAELIHSLTLSKFHTIHRLVADAHCYETLIDLFFAFEWNSILHHLVTSTLQTLLEHSVDDVKVSLFSVCKLHQKIAQAALHEVNTTTSRRGYMGHLTRMSTIIENEAEMNKDIRTALDESTEWSQYVAGDLTESRSKERGGTVLRSDTSSHGDSSDDDHDADDSGPAQSPVQNFHDDFPEDFGVVDYEEDDSDVIFDATQYVLPGFNTDEEGFGKEFESDSDEEPDGSGEDDEEEDEEDDDEEGEEGEEEGEEED